MATIVVYRYKLYSDLHDTYVDTNIPVYAPLDKIGALKNAQVIVSSALEIDESELSEQGFYHPNG